MGRGNSVDYAPNTSLSVIGLMKGKQLNRQSSSSIMQSKICLKFKYKLFIICTRQDPSKKVTRLHCAVDITNVDPFLRLSVTDGRYFALFPKDITLLFFLISSPFFFSLVFRNARIAVFFLRMCRP